MCVSSRPSKTDMMTLAKIGRSVERLMPKLNELSFHILLTNDGS